MEELFLLMVRLRAKAEEVLLRPLGTVERNVVKAILEQAMEGEQILRDVVRRKAS